MARNTKTTKRSSSVKKRGLFSKVNFGSRRTQFITVILLVAVLGGGWFTYRSFAATTISWNGNQLEPAYGGGSRTKDAAKNQATVFKLSDGQGVSGLMDGSVVNNITADGKQYRVCATLRTENPGTILLHGGPRPASKTTYWRNVDVSGNSYKEYCTPYTAYNKGDSFDGVSMIYYGTSNAFVSAMRIDSNSTQSTPTK